MGRLTHLADALTQARIRLPLLRRSCYMSQRTFFGDMRSRANVEHHGVYYLRPWEHPAVSEHARLSPSGSKRWFACPGSLALEAAFPNTSSEYSDSGTAMHEVASICLTGGNNASEFEFEPIFVNDEGEPQRTVEFTHAMAETVQGYVDTVRALAVGNEMHVEQRVEFSRFVYGTYECVDGSRIVPPDFESQFGTADAILLIDDLDTGETELFLIDLKTGFKFVEAENNTQLLLYALGAWDKFKAGRNITRVRCGIYQPAHGGMREWVVPVGDLK